MWQIPIGDVIDLINYINTSIIFLYQNVVLIICVLINVTSIIGAIICSRKRNTDKCIKFCVDGNKQIYACIEKIIKDKAYPPYAIMINGAWGIGKTYFINAIIKNNCIQDKTDILYVSVYGKKDISDIKDEIKEKSFKKDYLRTILKVLIQILNVLPIDKISVKKEVIQKYINKRIQEINVFNIWDVVIVDDLERTRIDICDIWGYFNEFIINDTLVIFACNENDILNRDEKNIDNNFKEYSIMKEKIINTTFLLEPEIDGVVSNQVKKYEKCWGEYYKIINNKFNSDDISSIIKNAIKITKLKNMRIIESLLFDYNLLLNKLFSCLKIHCNDSENCCVEEYIKRFTEKYFIIYIYYKDTGHLDDINTIWKKYYGKKYMLQNILIVDNAWEKIVYDAKYYDDTWFNIEIENGYNNFRNIFKHSDILFKIRESLIYNSNDKIISEENVKIMFKNFKDEKYISIEEVYTYIEVYFSLIKNEIIPESYTINDLVDEVNTFVDENISKIDFKDYEIYFRKVHDEQVDALFERLNKIAKEKCNSNINKKQNFIDMISNQRNYFNYKYSLDQFEAKDIFEWLTVEGIEEKFIDFCNVYFYVGVDTKKRDLSKDINDIEKCYSVINDLKELYVKKANGCKYNYTIEWIKYDEMVKELDAVLEHILNIKYDIGKRKL